MKGYTVLSLTVYAVVLISSCTKENNELPEHNLISAGNIMYVNGHPGDFFCLDTHSQDLYNSWDSAKTIWKWLYPGPDKSTVEITSAPVVTRSQDDRIITAQKCWTLFKPGKHALGQAAGAVDGFTIIYTDSSGHKWYSELASTTKGSTFVFFDTKVELIAKHRQYLFGKANFSCQLYDQQGNSMRLSAIALPLGATLGF